MQEYTILIPAYNEEKVVSEVLRDLGKPHGCREIILIDDGSTDNTADIARKAGIQVLTHSYNKGYGAALKSGIQQTKTDFVVCFDSDGQHRREDLLKIVTNLNAYDMVVGARGKGSIDYWNRSLGKKILFWVSYILTQRKIPDLTSGLRAFRTSVIQKYLHLMPDGFSFSTTSTIAMFRMGYTVHYVPITARVRSGRKSSVKFFEDGFKTFMLIINLTVLFNPMRVFIPLSGLFILASIIYFIVYSLMVRLHLTPSMVLLFITGVIIFSLGIICEQVSAIRRELYK